MSDIMGITKNDRIIFKYLEVDKNKKVKGITISQAGMMLRPGKRYTYAYDYARKRLQRLHDMGFVKYFRNDVTDEYIYYLNDDKKKSDEKNKPNIHDTLVNNFYANIVFYQCEVLHYQEKQRWLDDKIISDSFIIYRHGDKTKAAIIECDLNHPTQIEKYEKLYESNILQQEYGDFPYVVIMSPVDRKVSSENFVVVNIELDCSGFASKVLSL
jgi:hypothetical protein